jgi:hypothetical protein
MNLFPETRAAAATVADPTAKFRKALPPVAPIRRFADLRTSEPPAPVPAVPSPSGMLLPVGVPCYLLRVICHQWDLYRFVVGDSQVNSCSAKFARRMPGIVTFLRAQARRICPETGGMAWHEKNRGALLSVECSPEDLYALLFFCCAGHGGSLDPVRDVIEPVLSAYEAAQASLSAQDGSGKGESS